MALLTTKFYLPPLRPTLVTRQRLRQQLNEGLQHHRPLTLVSAPAGYGKTTLIAGWLQEGRGEEKPVPAPRIAWLSLDEDDDEPIRFFSYLGAALEEAGESLKRAGQKVQAALQAASQLPPVEGLVVDLLNEIGEETGEERLILVLDDYHKIRAPLIHEAIQLLVAYAPPHLHLVLITREDPPLPLARWRVRGQMTEIRASDLRFTEEEATTFLNNTMGLDLAAADVAALERRTEGWIAGLQLAAIALQSTAQSDASNFIVAFSGSHHYVIDYLVEEVLRQQEEEVRAFLRETAILERLNASLCNAVTGRDDSRAILTRLERENLFLIPLDAQRQWYRYHHLLADSLRTGLDASLEARLHQHATAWYENHGFPAAAVRHALATGDLSLAADVIERVIQEAPAWSRGEVARLTGWLDRLSSSLLRSRPALSLHASRALYLAGQMDRAEQLLDQAEEGLRAGATATEGREALLALVTVYRAAIAAMHGEALAEAIKATRQVVDMPAAVGTHTRARAADTLGLAHELRGEAAAAERAYLQAAELAEAAGVRYLAINARCEAALVQISQGQLGRATQTCREALALGDEDQLPPAGLAWAILGEIARERNRLGEAEQHLATGIELSHQGGITDDLRYSYLFLARLRQAQGDPDAALAAWREGDRILRAYNVPRLAALAAAARARLDLALGNVAQARRWAADYEQVRQSNPGAYLREEEDLLLARVYLATERPEEALAFARDLEADAYPEGRLRTIIEALILQALALHAQGETAAATTALGEALVPASREGFVRILLDAGTVVARLLPGAKAAAPDFVEELLDAFAGELPQSGEAGPIVPPPAHLVEPLSDREQEVLALLVAGRSNREIAEELVITVGTAKWHVHNIYQKLDVGSRAEAIARTHEWQLLDG